MQEILHHDINDDAHIQSVAAIPEIIENAIYIDSAENEDKIKNPNIEKYHYYVCELKIGKEDYTVKMVVAEHTDGQRYYDHGLTQIEKGQLLDQLFAITSHGFNQKAPLSEGKDKRLMSILQTDSSKCVDKNGEPQVVYHGTPHFGFSVFDEEKTSFGIFFSTKARASAAYTGKARATFPQITDGQPRPDGGIYSCFINTKNTLHVTPSNKSMWNGVSSHSIQLSQQDLDFINREHKLTPEDRRNNTDEYFLSKFKEDYDSWTEVTTDDIARLAKILGYDAVHISRVRDGNRTVADDWVMLDGGATIKSATENVGTYDANNNDIRFAIGRKRKEDMRRGLLNKLTNGKEKKKSTVQNRAGSPAKAGANATVISGDAASNLQTYLNNLAKKYNNKRTRTRGFITDLTQALGLEQHEASRYRNFELPDGRFVTFRLSNHNASAVTFDEHGEHEGISIVISSSRNNGIKNNGSAHVVEYFYGKKILDRAEGNPLAAIVKSVSEMFKTGEYVDTTGLAEVSEVNPKNVIRVQTVYGKPKSSMVSQMPLNAFLMFRDLAK